MRGGRVNTEFNIFHQETEGQNAGKYIYCVRLRRYSGFFEPIVFDV